jgi:tRNA (cytidine/uridine-2'-O-)-methyltransferase
MISIVLYQPKNPFNFAGIARTAALLGATLHLIEPIDFALGKTIKRFSMGYSEDVEVIVHAAWPDFIATLASDARLWLLSDKGASIYSQVEFKASDYLVFGSEMTGLPPEILAAHPALAIPMPGAARGPRRDHREHSLNVSVSVAIAAFEAARQLSGNWQESI